jgi:hypothetical protein
VTAGRRSRFERSIVATRARRDSADEFFVTPREMISIFLDHQPIVSPVISKSVPKPDEPLPPQPYYDEHGRFIHYCHCGKWGTHGVGYFPREGKLGRWYCREHRPVLESDASAAAPVPVKATFCVGDSVVPKKGFERDELGRTVPAGIVNRIVPFGKGQLLFIAVWNEEHGPFLAGYFDKVARES